MTDWNFQIYVGTSVTDEELEIGIALCTELNYLDKHDLMGKNKEQKHPNQNTEVTRPRGTALKHKSMYGIECDRDM